MRRLKLLAGVCCLLLAVSACGRKQQEKPVGQPADTTATAVDTLKKTAYAALSTDSTQPVTVDTTNPAMKEVIGRFPAAHFVKGTFEYQGKAFLGADSLDEIYTADYQIGNARVQLFLTDDRSGIKFVRLTQFATRHSQVKGASMAFDEGYSVVFHHAERGWVVAGLKAGYLLGAVGYDDSSVDFISRWVKALK